jgi:predicted O-methyltransferase YrrM
MTTMKFRDTPRFTPKWFLTLPFTAQDIYKRLTPRDGAVQEMQYWFFGQLERRPIELVLPRAAEASYRVTNAGRRQPGTSTTLFELSCVLMALDEVKAKRVLEIGTFDGNTTLNLALNVPDDGQVVTIDLPVEGSTDYALRIDGAELRNVTDRRIVGEQFKGHALEKKIRQVFGDSARIDFGALGGPFDLAFIDGCHDYAYVVSDTENVLKVMRSGGIILWHDYAMMEPVSRAVDGFRDRIDRLVAIEGTRLAIGWVR